jgi:hypothetical protein
MKFHWCVGKCLVRLCVCRRLCATSVKHFFKTLFTHRPRLWLSSYKIRGRWVKVHPLDDLSRPATLGIGHNSAHKLARGDLPVLVVRHRRREQHRNIVVKFCLLVSHESLDSLGLRIWIFMVCRSSAFACDRTRSHVFARTRMRWRARSRALERVRTRWGALARVGARWRAMARAGACCKSA